MSKVNFREFLEYLLKPSNGDVLYTMLQIFLENETEQNVSSDDDGNLLISHKYIGILSDYHRDTVKRCLVNLESLNLITCKIRDNKAQFLNAYNIEHDTKVYAQLLDAKITRCRNLKYKYDRENANRILLPYKQEFKRYSDILDLFINNL